MGFFSNLIDGLTGKASEDAADAISGAARTSRKEIEGLIGDFFRPAAEDEQAAQNAIAAFLGLRGVDAERGAFANLERSPSEQAAFEAGLEAIDQAAAAGGALNSGGRLIALQEAGEREFADRVNNRLARLSSFRSGASGDLFGVQQAANQQRGIGAQATAEGIIGRSNAATGFANQLVQLAAFAAGGGFGGGGALGGAGAFSGGGNTLQRLGTPLTG